MQQLIPFNCVEYAHFTLYTAHYPVYMLYTRLKELFVMNLRKYVDTYQICRAGLSFTRVVIWCNSVKGGFI